MQRLLTEQQKPWGDVIAASLIVMLATLSGVFCFSLAKVVRRVRGKDFDSFFWQKLNNIVIPSFGCGAILATAVFLIIPEALELLAGGEDHSTIENSTVDDQHHEIRYFTRYLEGNETANGEHSEEHTNESTIAWKFGASLLGGFLLPMLLGGIFHHSHHHDHAADEGHVRPAQVMPHEKQETIDTEDVNQLDVVDEEGSTNDTSDATKTDELAPEVSAKPVQAQKNWALILTILMGDGIHNFCDGVFIGTAFLICGKSFAYSMVVSTIYHELAQEISDYALLVDLGGLNTCQALALNFLSGSSVLIGGLLAMGIEFSDMATGSILAISSGSFIYIAGCECIPRIQQSRKGLKDNALFVLFFFFGAIPIGLVLLNHGHCEE